jgi:hypothetical protein
MIDAEQDDKKKTHGQNMPNYSGKDCRADIARARH